MATDKKRRNRSRANKPTASKTPKQIAIVGILLVVLLVAVITQPESTDATNEVGVDGLVTQVAAPIGTAPVVQLSGRPLDNEPTASIAEPHPSLVQTKPLASIPLDDWVDHNPFSRAQMETLDQSMSGDDGTLQIRAIYGHGNEAVALVGRRLIRIGETLPDGRTVVNITSDGVELAR